MKSPPLTLCGARQCGDVCCRRCLGFCLVDVPLLGVDLAFTCARCIRRVAAKPPAFPDLEASGVSYMTIMSSPLSSSSLSSSSSVDQLVTSPSCPSSPASAAHTPTGGTGLSATFNGSSSSSDQLPTSFSSALQTRSAGDRPKRVMTPFDVTVSQSRSAKLQSVCALVGDYLECAGAAVVLLSPDRHVWVVAHRGLSSRLLHDDAFLALCHRGRDQNTSFAQSEPKSRTAGAAQATDTFRFAAVAPLRHRQTADSEDDAYQDDEDDTDSELDGDALGCLLALDTRARSDAAASRIRKTLENLARLVMDLLAEEKSILRIFESGDFKMFAANAMDLAPATASVFAQCGVASSSAAAAAITTANISTTTNSTAATAGRRKRSTPMPLTGGLLSSMVMNRLRRSRSFNCVDCEIAAAAAATAAASPSPTPSPVAASPSPGTPTSRRARRVVIEDDGFDIVAHPGMNRGRKHAASNVASGRPACTSNCRTGPHRHRRRDQSASVASSSTSAPTSTAA